MTRLSKSGIDYAHGGDRGDGKERIGYRWNFWTGCSNTACPCRADCWALAMCRRFGWAEKPCMVPDYRLRLNAPLDMANPARFLVNFISDFFDAQIDGEHRLEIWRRVLHCPQHQFIFLTKQYAAAERFFGERAVLPNVWVGASACNYESAEAGLLALRRVSEKGWHTWLSLEPLIDSGFAVYPVRAGMVAGAIEWIVIGALSRNGRTVPPDRGGTRPEGIGLILVLAPDCKVGVWLKSNLEPIIRQVIDPRTGEPFASTKDWQDPIGGA